MAPRSSGSAFWAPSRSCILVFIRIALDYAAEHTDEIRERIDSNRGSRPNKAVARRESARRCLRDGLPGR